MKDLYVAEYSASQDSFHRQLLTDSLASNRRRAASKEKNDWVPIFIGSPDECVAAIQKIVKIHEAIE
jgi:hypothetical protein